MKKKITLWGIMLLFCISLAGCSIKSKPAKETEKLISAIGEVSLDSLDAIQEAEEYYETLTDKQKDEIENYKVLVDARSKYDELMATEKAKQTAKEIDETITKLSSQTSRKQSDIDSLISKYDSLSDEQKKYVEKADQIDKVLELTEYEKVSVAAIKALKKSLKNENSLKVKSITVAKGKSEAVSPYYAYIEYSAENSFGGTKDSSVTIDVTSKFVAGFWELSSILGGYDKNELLLYNDYLNHSSNKVEVDVERTMSNCK